MMRIEYWGLHWGPFFWNNPTPSCFDWYLQPTCGSYNKMTYHCKRTLWVGSCDSLKGTSPHAHVSNTSQTLNILHKSEISTSNTKPSTPSGVKSLRGPLKGHLTDFALTKAWDRTHILEQPSKQSRASAVALRVQGLRF